jgi:hypothetical protein
MTVPWELVLNGASGRLYLRVREACRIMTVPWNVPMVVPLLNCSIEEQSISDAKGSESGYYPTTACRYSRISVFGPVRYIPWRQVRGDVPQGK